MKLYQHWAKELLEKFFYAWIIRGKVVALFVDAFNFYSNPYSPNRKSLVSDHPSSNGAYPA